MSVVEQSSSENFISHIWNGNAGLAMTHWVYGVVGGFAWGIALVVLQPVPGSGTAKVFLGCWAAYFAFVYVGEWRAANKYQGKRIWASLAKFGVVFGTLVGIIPVVIVFFQSAVSQ